MTKTPTDWHFIEMLLHIPPVCGTNSLKHSIAMENEIQTPNLASLIGEVHKTDSKALSTTSSVLGR